MIIMGILPVGAGATVIHVPDDYSTIQAAINASANGDTVMVAQGTYAENVNYHGKNILLKSEDGPDATIIEALDPGMPAVIFTSGESSTAVLDGFTVRLAYDAPGIEIADSDPVIKNNIVLSNDGGLVAEGGAHPEIIDNVLVNNSATSGAGMLISQADAVVSGNRFISNSASDHGGGIFVWQSNASLIHHNLFYQNQSDALGGGICLIECMNLEIYNNTIAFNSTSGPYTGAGIAVWDSHECLLYNNIIANNQGEGIFQGMIFSSQAVYNDLWGNDNNYYGIEPGQGSISANPMFVGGVPYSFNLMETSPCIDSGDPDSPYDPDGTPADMGAYFYRQGPGISIDIGDVVGYAGDSVAVPILAYGISDVEISGVEFHIDYDDSRLIFDECQSEYFENILVNAEDGVIHLLWEDFADPVNIPDSTAIILLQFGVEGEVGDSCFVSWDSNNEIVDPNGDPVIGLEYIDGYVMIDEELENGDDVFEPTEFGLSCRNYPNPFNGQTTIQFEIAQRSEVTLRVVDILGRLTDTIAEGVYSAGRYNFVWNSGENPSGIYFLVLKTGGNTAVGKMILLK